MTTDVAFVLGGAISVWTDVIRATSICEGSGRRIVVVACNDAGSVWPGELHHWATYHPELMEHWMEKRAALGFKPAGEYWTQARNNRYPPPGPRYKELNPIGGSSGLLAAQVGLEVADKVILCGIPMDGSVHIRRKRPWDAYEEHRKAWWAYGDKLRGRVKSMGGWTQEFLGAPDKGWLK